MDKENVRQSLNRFLKMYFDACREVYDELDNKELLTGRQFQYLKKIGEKESVTSGELAEWFNLSKPTVTEMIKRFEQSGLVTKKQSEEDGRVYYIALSEQGKTLANTNILESKRAVEKIFGRLDEQDIATLTTLFDKIGQV